MTARSSPTVDAVVVGAGMAGLTAARSLRAGGFSVTVLDKGRAVGGRMATRRFGGGRFDHGAQHFSVRSAEFAEAVAGWLGAGVARVWFESASVTRPERGVEPRHAGVDGMRGIPEHLAAGLDIRLDHLVAGIDCGEGVTVVGESWRIAGRSLILTAPLPQSLQLLDRSGVGLAAGIRESLDAITYDPTLAVLARTEESAALDDGHAAFDDGPVAWVADNHHKGISPVPALTIHSDATFGRTHVDDEVEAWTAELVAAAESRLQVRVIEARGHRWRFAQPRSVRDDGAVLARCAAPIVVAGEAFAGARVEGAFQSGCAAAALVAERLG